MVTVSNLKLPPVLSRMFDLLIDGKWRSVDVLKRELDDPLADVGAVKVHIYNLKQTIMRHGLTLVHEYEEGVTGYRMVRYIDDE